MEILKITFYRLLLYLAGGITIAIVFCPVCFFDEEQNNFHVIRYYVILFALLWEVTHWISRSIDRKIEWIERPLRKSLIMLSSHLLILVPLTFIFSFVAFRVIGPPFDNSYVYLYYLPMQHTLVGLFIGFFRNSRNFLDAWKNSVRRIEKLEREQAEYQLQALKNQVNPHFLFNNLNTLISLINPCPDTAERFGNQLANVYRYLLEEKNNGLITIEKELNFLESYIYLLKIRFSDNVKIDMSTDQLKHFSIAPFTLQLLLENAIKHNVVSSEHPLHIDLFLEQRYLIVRNTIRSKNLIDYSTGIGLQNIINRYSLLTPKAVQIEENAQYFMVKLPIIDTTL